MRLIIDHIEGIMTIDRTFTVDRNLAEDHVVSFVAQIHEKRVGTLSRIDGAIEVLKSAEKASGIAPVCDILVAVSLLLEKVKVPSPCHTMMSLTLTYI